VAHPKLVHNKHPNQPIPTHNHPQLTTLQQLPLHPKKHTIPTIIPQLKHNNNRRNHKQPHIQLTSQLHLRTHTIPQIQNTPNTDTQHTHNPIPNHNNPIIPTNETPHHKYQKTKTTPYPYTKTFHPNSPNKTYYTTTSTSQPLPTPTHSPPIKTNQTRKTTRPPTTT